VLFSNPSTLTLEQGPVAIYAKGELMGEAFISRISPKDVTFLTYALEPRLSLRSQPTQKDSAMRIIRVQHGVMVSEVKTERSVEYTLNNQSDDDMQVYIKTSAPAQFKALNLPKKTVHSAGQTMYVPMQAKANNDTALTLRWE